MNASSEIRLPVEPAALATEAVRSFSDRLKRLLHRRISPKLRPRVDAEDVLQSAYRSFFVAAGRRQFELATPQDCWNLLRAFALHKLQRQIEWHTAGKRDYHRHCDESRHLQSHAVAVATPSQHVGIQELYAATTKEFSEAERVAMELLQQGYSRDRIAREMRRSPRTVRRLLARCESRLSQCLKTSPGDEHQTPLAPLRYADYVLEKLVGAGGMGKVFRARDKVSGSIVAVKALHKSRQRDLRAVERFVQESQILQRLSHPHIVRVEGLGQFPSGGHFMVMDFVEGRDLESHLREGAFGVSFVRQVVRQIAAALAYAHAHGVVHGDLKPANVMVARSGKVTVTDFGFAHLVSPTRYGPQTIGGTLGYMAPEVVSGHSPPSPASDVYSFGRLVMELVDSLRIEPSTCATVQALTQTSRRSLEISAAHRYRDASELLQELGDR